jgi:pimeloyl-ACP methyl ester carboxylesterase
MSDPFDGLKTASVNGVSLAYRDIGSGEPVVLIHGSASDLRTWDGQLAAIGADHRAIAYSRRYARPNDDIKEGVDDQMLPHVEDLAGFLAAIDVPAAHLVGHSWGGFVALLTAIRHPALVRSLVLMEPPVLSLFVSTPPRPSEILGLLVRRPGTALAIIKFGVTAFEPARKAYLNGDDEAAMAAFGRGVLGKAGFETLSEERREQVWENRMADRAQILGAGFPPLSDDEVRGVQAPTLLMCGDRSPALFHRLSDRLAELLPNVERAEIAGASHMMQEDNALMVNETILGFLARQTAAAA